MIAELRDRLRRRAGPTTIVTVCSPALIVFIWWRWSESVDSFFFPPLSEILDSFREEWVFERVGSDLVPSLRRFGLGYLLASVLGVAAGLVIGLNRLVARAIAPLIEFMRAFPPVALLPFTIVVVGIEDRGKVFLIVLGAVWPILLNTIDGIRGIDPELVDTARSFGASSRELLLTVRVPAALPQILAGMRSSLSIALILTVISELWAATEGVGFFVLQAQRSFDIPGMWSGMLVLSIVGLTLNTAFSLAESRALRWYHRRTRLLERQ